MKVDWKRLISLGLMLGLLLSLTACGDREVGGETAGSADEAQADVAKKEQSENARPAYAGKRLTFPSTTRSLSEPRCGGRLADDHVYVL